jgi:hypothetical protein
VCSGTSYQGAGERKVARDNEVPRDVLKLLGEDDFRMTQLIKKIYKNGKWSKDFTEVTMTALERKPKATKCSDHRTISLITHTAKTVASILRRRIERKFSNYVETNSFNIEEEKGTMDSIGMLRMKSEITLDIDDKLCACFRQAEGTCPCKVDQIK